MSRLAPQPDYAAPVVQEFIEWVRDHCIDGTNGPSAMPNRPFMPFPSLQAYLKAHNRMSKLLRAMYSERDYHHAVTHLENWYTIVFSILILIGKGNYIMEFSQHTNLRDHHLPFLGKPLHFPTDPDDPTFWSKFCEEQFAFCAHTLEYNDIHTKLEDSCILPIVSKEELARGGSAAIYKILLHPYYDKLNSAADDPMIRAYSSRLPNTYVLKTYNTKDASMYYENEVAAFKKLTTKDRNDHSLIQFLGSYKQGDSYNILLEYANHGTLENFFQNVAPPTLAEDIVMFWERLFNVIKALSRIHASERPDGFRGPDVLIGWHQDVKPSNILVLSGKTSHVYDVEFKLADLGLSHFKRTAKLDRKIADSDVGGTKDYGAPECYRSDEFLEQSKIEVKPLVDIWSFGGVCSEAAVWVVLGMSGLTAYRNQRQQEITGKDTIQDGSCFHDGENVLKTVEDMHNRLEKKGEVRPGDCVTKPVLEHMVSAMLSEDPDDRFNANWHWRKSQKILKAARSRVERPTHNGALRQADSIVDKEQLYGQTAPETPPHTSHGATQSAQGDHHQYGAPPFLLQYSSDPQTPARSPSIKDTLKRRSDTWHDHSTGTNLALGLSSGSPSLPAAKHQTFRASPPPDIYKTFQGPTDTRVTDPDETRSDRGGTSWQSFESMRNSLPNGSRDVGSVDRRSTLHQFNGGSTLPSLHSGEGNHPSQHIQSDAGLEPLPLQDNGAFRTTPESLSQHSNVAKTTTGHETPPPAQGLMSNETRQRSHPNTPHTSSTVKMPIVDPPVFKTKDEIPFLSYKEAKRAREKHGVLPPRASGFLEDLRERDHVFLMDDSLSMKEHWDDVISLFSVFGYFTKRLDKDRLEMYYTVSETKETFKHTSPAVASLKNIRHTSDCNIDIRLGKILRNYQQALDKHEARKTSWLRARPVKPLSLYVFTDGAWHGCDAIAPIEAMIEKLKQLGLPKEQVGIQFIRFGNDQAGIQRLEYLDTGLRKKYGKNCDIVDTEPFTDGNLLKMLLGAVWDWFDSHGERGTEA